MSPSSSGSWERAGDVIDLDKYMRGAVRPSVALSDPQTSCEQLVVDGGGVGLPRAGAGAGGGAGGGGARYKLHSHDSGVSDGSFETRAPRRPRRASNTDGRARAPRDQFSARTFNRVEHSDSLREFRTVCQQALIDQQKQISRVAQLCELLTERASERLSKNFNELPERPEQIERERVVPFHESITKRNELGRDRREDHLERSDRISDRKEGERFERVSERSPERYERLSDRSPEPGRTSELLNSVERVEKVPSNRTQLIRSKRFATSRAASDTSDISSSSRSTKDLQKKEKNRTQECKTYKIIMSKLDELSRRFSPRPPPCPPPPPRTPSSSIVSVCDKLIATDPETRILRPSVKIHYQASPRPPAASLASSMRPRVVAQAYNVDIAPRDAFKNPNVATESVVKCESDGSGTSAVGDPRCNFDLEDPVHLYSQAKRLQAMTASTKHTRSHSSEPRNARDTTTMSSVEEQQTEGGVEGTETKREPRARSPSLCSVCRGYWRLLRQCLAASFTQDCKCS